MIFPHDLSVIETSASSSQWIFSETYQFDRFISGIAISRLTNIVHILINGLFIVIVANIPQGVQSSAVFSSFLSLSGLPVMLTTQLLIVSRRLARKGVFLKRWIILIGLHHHILFSPDTADTLSRTTVLLVEKTGVLTENSATLTDVWMDGEKKTSENEIRCDPIDLLSQSIQLKGILTISILNPSSVDFQLIRMMNQWIEYWWRWFSVSSFFMKTYEGIH